MSEENKNNPFNPKLNLKTGTIALVVLVGLVFGMKVMQGKKDPCEKPYDVPACFEKNNKMFQEMKTVEGQKALIPVFKDLCENYLYFKSCYVCYSMAKDTDDHDLRVKFAKLFEQSLDKSCKEGNQAACGNLENAKKIVSSEEMEKAMRKARQ